MVKKSVCIIILFCATQISSMDLEHKELYGQKIKRVPIRVHGSYEKLPDQSVYECKSLQGRRLSSKAWVRFLRKRTVLRKQLALID